MGVCISDVVHLNELCFRTSGLKDFTKRVHVRTTQSLSIHGLSLPAWSEGDVLFALYICQGVCVCLRFRVEG